MLRCWVALLFLLLAVPARPQEVQGTPSIHVSAVEFRGNAVVPTADLEAATAPFTNRPLHQEDLNELLQTITRLYIERGFIASGARLPDQDPASGTLVVEVVEGKLETVRLHGLERTRAAYIEGRLRRGIEQTLNIDVLRNNIALLLEGEVVDKLTATLEPGVERGTAVVDAEVSEHRWFEPSVNYDSGISPALGAHRLGGRIDAVNALGFGESAGLLGEYAEGIRKLAVDLSVPVTANDLTLIAGGEYGDFDVVEEPFSELNITAESARAFVGVERPFLRRPGSQLLVSATFERARNQTFLFDSPFSFSPGVNDGRSDVSVARFAAAWVRRSADTVLYAEGRINWGLAILGAARHPQLPDGRFVSMSTFASVARRIGRHEIVARAGWQQAFDALLPSEKATVGGLDSVRGFRVNALVVDSGGSASIEFRTPLLSTDDGLPVLRAAAFFDLGGGHERFRAGEAPPLLYGTGGGLLFDPTRWLSASVYWAHDIGAFNTRGDNFQDHGLSFRLRIALP